MCALKSGEIVVLRQIAGHGLRMVNINSTNDFKLIAFKKEKRVRYIFLNKLTFKPSVAMSIYETHLMNKSKSHNSVYDELQKMTYLYTWAKRNNINMDEILLQGKNLKTADVRMFALHLNGLSSRKGGKLKIKTCNAILNGCCTVIIYFMKQYGEFGDEKFESGTQSAMRGAAVEVVKSCWKEVYKKHKKRPMANDLTELEIESINNFLKPKTERLINADPIVIRDYLCWRLVIEFGLRIGEVLSLRLEDCPSRGKEYLSIVRIEERGSEYYDQRIKPPRPKTLSRELGFLLTDSPLPRLISEYISRCRTRAVKRNGKKRIIHILDEHPFLITARETGKPLSVAAFEKIADKIKQGTGIKHFHWHLGRHAFFNRAWSAIADNPKYKDRKMDLVYWGGWENENSLQMYINRARKKKARHVMKIWISRSNDWKALQ